MSGRAMELSPGRYRLDVNPGVGPAGVRRTGGDGDVRVGETGGQVEFTVSRAEKVYFWWRGPEQPEGIRLLSPGQKRLDPSGPGAGAEADESAARAGRGKLRHRPALTTRATGPADGRAGATYRPGARRRR